MDRERPAILVSVVPEGAQESVRIDVSEMIESWEYEDCEDKADKLKLTVDNYSLAEFDNPVWKKGNLLFFQFGYAGVLAPSRKCIIEKVTGFAKLSIEANGLEMTMNAVQRLRAWENMTRSEIVATLASEWGYGEDARFVEATEQRFEVVSQAGESDAAFLKRLAQKQGFVFFLDFDGFHWHSRQTQARTHRVYTYFNDPGQGNVMSISIDNDVTAKRAITRERGRDPESKEDISTGADTDLPIENMPLWGEGAPEHPISPVPEIVGTAIRERGMEMIGNAGRLTNVALDQPSAFREVLLREAERQRDAGRAMLDLPQTTSLEHVNGSVVMRAPDSWADRNWSEAEQAAIFEAQEVAVGLVRTTYTTIHRSGGEGVATTPAATQEEAETTARARQVRIQQTAVKMKMKIIGDPTLLAKTMVELRCSSRRLSGSYYVSSVLHKGGSNYTSELRMVADGTRGYGDPSFPEVVRPNATPPAPAEEVPFSVRGVREEERVDPDGGIYRVFVDQHGREVPSVEAQRYQIATGEI